MRRFLFILIVITCSLVGFNQLKKSSYKLNDRSYSLVNGNNLLTSLSYKCYNPTIDISTIIAAKRNFFQYNHDPSIAFFDGYFYAFWNGLAKGGKERSEGEAGQLNYMSRSVDANHWSQPVAIFNDPAYTFNPLPDNPGKYQQWQPNVTTLDDRMLIIWSETGKSNRSYLSILLKGDKKIKTYRIEINVKDLSIKLNSDLSSETSGNYSNDYPYNGKFYFIYSTQNPFKLTNGRILIPFSIEESQGDFEKRKKWASFIYSDNPKDINSFKFAELTPGMTETSAWEPFFTESVNGKVYMHMRNLSSKTTDKNMSIATASGNNLTFQKPVVSSLTGPSSRAFAQKVSANRFMMVYNDADKNTRINGVANFSRTGGYDFTPGVSLQKDIKEPGDLAFNYPQSVIHDDTAYVIYSTVYEPRSIMLAKFRLGLPDDSLLILPRNRPRVYLSGYIDKKKRAVACTGSKTFKLNNAMLAGDYVNSNGSFTIGAWVKKQKDQNMGTLFDNRGTVPGSDFSGKGFAIGVSEISLGNAASGINLTANLDYDFAASGYSGLVNQLLSTNSYIGVTVNTPGKILSVYMDDGSYVSGTNSKFYEANYSWQAIQVNSNFRDGQTITIDNKVYTFRKAPATNDDIGIGKSTAITCFNLKKKLSGIITAGFSENGKSLTQSDNILLVFFKKNSTLNKIVSTNSSVKPYNKNFIDGPSASIGSSIKNSGLPGFVGYLYNMRIYKGNNAAKDATFHRYLFNLFCKQFGYNLKHEGSNAKDDYYLDIPYNSSLLVNSMVDTSRTEYACDNKFLTLYSNSSAGIETQGDIYKLTIPFKVANSKDASPIICSFQDANQQHTITIDSSGVIKCNNKILKTVDIKQENIITLFYNKNIMTIDDKIKIPVSYRPTLFLGTSDFFAPLNGAYSISYNLDKLKLNLQ